MTVKNSMIDLCPIREEKKGFSSRIISDLPEFISSGKACAPFPVPRLLRLCMERGVAERPYTIRVIVSHKEEILIFEA